MGSSLGLIARLHHRADGLKLGGSASIGRVFGESSWSFTTVAAELAYRFPGSRQLELGVHAGIQQGRRPSMDQSGGLHGGPAGVRATWRLPLASGAAILLDAGFAYAGYLIEERWALTGAVLFEFPR
jgi:hypothetical protein